ncbi:MAG TPA: c-type cytochrome [Thermomicrobiaceae bacterium]|nr:c-type cytochrome [Thermomicrobiaceae bacterium]
MGSTSPEKPPRRRIPWAAVILGVAIGVVGTLGLIAMVGGPLAIGHRTDLPLERVYGGVAVSIAARLHAGNQSNPLAGDPRAIETGRTAYTGSCAICHGADGKGTGVFGTASYPNATDLTTGDARERTDAQLFWIIKNGLSFTGMPGFGKQYQDQDIWAMVSFLRSLQQGGAAAISVPTPTTAELAAANPRGSAVQRGAAVYFALGCQTCHGPTGNTPGELGLREGGREAARTIRDGRAGMPAYDQVMVSDAELTDLQAYLTTIGRGERGD